MGALSALHAANCLRHIAGNAPEQPGCPWARQRHVSCAGVAWRSVQPNLEFLINNLALGWAGVDV